MHLISHFKNQFADLYAVYFKFFKCLKCLQTGLTNSIFKARHLYFKHKVLKAEITRCLQVSLSEKTQKNDVDMESIDELSISNEDTYLSRDDEFNYGSEENDTEL